MAPRVVILGGGTGGTLAANRLRRRFDAEDLAITVVDGDDRHLYQPGLLFVPFGMAPPRRLVRSRRAQLSASVDFRLAAADGVDVAARTVALADGSRLPYDVLVIATGAGLAWEETEGLTGTGWGEKVFTFYELRSAAALAGAMAGFEKGRLVVNIVDMPVKCPVAPLEFCFLADWFFHRRGMRDQVEISLVTPLDGAFSTKLASERLGGLLADKGISMVTEFNTASVDGSSGALSSFDGRQVPFDLAVVVPVHAGAPFVRRSEGLGNEFDFVPCDIHSLQAKAAPEIFVIGDAAEVPTSKAGSVAHFEGEVLTRNIARFLAGEPLDASFDGHANCFVESGFGKAVLCDFNYEVEVLPGHFPSRFGLPLLEQSRACHAGKLAFEWLYWHAVLPGREIPGIATAMPRAGKRGLAPAATGPAPLEDVES